MGTVRYMFSDNREMGMKPIDLLLEHGVRSHARGRGGAARPGSGATKVQRFAALGLGPEGAFRTDHDAVTVHGWSVEKEGMTE